MLDILKEKIDREYYTLSEEDESRVSKIHKKSLIIDALTVCKFTDSQLQRMLDVGITAINKSVDANNYFFYDFVTKGITKIYSNLNVFRDKIFLATTANDIIKAKKQGQIACFLGLQNSLPIENKLSLLEVLYRLGIRIIQITYNSANLIGFGGGESRDFGLTDFGKDVIREMNRLGMIVDLGHVGYRTTLEAIEFSNAPAFVSHANVRKLADSPRNKSDDIIKAVAQTGGVINVYDSCFIREDDRDKTPEKMKGSIEDFIKHINYIVDLVGVDHVGIGLDLSEEQDAKEIGKVLLMRKKYNHLYPTLRIRPKGLQSYSDFPNITRGLLKEGYSDNDIQKILGLNNLRVYRKILKD